MDTDTTKIIYKLGLGEINTLLKLYYIRDGTIKGSKDLKEETLQSLIDKNMIITSLGENGNTISFTDYGLSVCGSVMFDRIKENRHLFTQKIQEFPERVIACLVNRVMWKDVVSKETGEVDPATKPYTLAESLGYERMLLKDERIIDILERFYSILDEVCFIITDDGIRICVPEVKNFLKERYRNIMDLS